MNVPAIATIRAGLSGCLLLGGILVPWGCARPQPAAKPSVSKKTPDVPSSDVTSEPLSTPVSDAPTVASDAAPVLADADDSPSKDQVGEANEPERFLLLAPGGPLVVEIRMTIDGQPYRQALEQLVDQVLAAADTDGDGEPTWAEVSESRRFIYGQFGNVAISGQQEGQRMIELYDADQDGVVDRPEVPRFVTRNRAGARGFSLRGSNFYRNYNRFESPLRRLIDADHNGTLSPAEMEAAPIVLRGRDADDDDYLLPNELKDNVTLMSANVTRRRRSGPRPARQLGPSSPWEVISVEIEELYGNGGKVQADSFPWLPDLFSKLDVDGSHELDEDEVAGLNQIEPHIELMAEFGRHTHGESSSALRVISLDLPAVSPVVSDRPGAVAVQLSDCELEFFVQDIASQEDIQQASTDQFAVYDADSNQYIDKDESESTARSFPGPFEAIDTNDDQKIYMEEYATYAFQQQAVARSQIRAWAGEQEDALFMALDTDNDGRLRAREMAAAPTRLRQLDIDGDGQLASKEIPDSIAVGFTRGEIRLDDAIFNRPSIPPISESGPRWFDRMDVNSDGDISLREFLGVASQFHELDKNQDNFIDRDEAQQAHGQ